MPRRPPHKDPELQRLMGKIEVLAGPRFTANQQEYVYLRDLIRGRPNDYLDVLEGWADWARHQKQAVFIFEAGEEPERFLGRHAQLRLSREGTTTMEAGHAEDATLVRTWPAIEKKSGYSRRSIERRAPDLVRRVKIGHSFEAEVSLEELMKRMSR